MRNGLLLLVCALVTTNSYAQIKHDDDGGSGTIVYGGSKDGDGWAFVVSAPSGWQFDCCNLARQRHANLLVFPDEWDGANPDRVMVLTVWSKDVADIDADWEADAKAYATKFPGVKSENFSVSAKNATCRSAVYSGTDHVRDYVVFCDSGGNLNYRFGWSMSLHVDETDVARTEAAFRQTVVSTIPMQLKNEKSPR
jgi:hypothetical protein